MVPGEPLPSSTVLPSTEFGDRTIEPQQLFVGGACVVDLWSLDRASTTFDL